MTSIADLLAGPAPRAKADRTGMYRLYDNFIGIDDGVTTPGERLGAGINGLGSALLSDPVGVISGMALGVKDDLDDLMFQGGAERRPEDVLGYAAAPMAPGALRGRVANVVSSSGAKPKKGIRAYHGSPHDFDRFSMDKIGTGEGAQAYGHGLYFAENEAVAQGYKQSVTRNGDQLRALAEKHGISGDAAEMLSYQFSMDDFHGQGFDRWLDGLKDQTERGWVSGRTKDAVEQIIRMEVEASDAVREMRKPGSMYEVRINADPDDFLDWDAPLSAQPEGVRAAVVGINAGDDPLLRELLDTSPEGMMAQGMVPGAKGSAAYRTLMERGFEDGAVGLNLPDGNPMKPADKWATERLRDAGIPGIKYKDAGSRGLDGQSGTRNFVVFDENLIEIVRKYGIAGAAAMLGISAQELQAQVDQQQSQKSGADEITDYLQSIGAQ